MSLKEVVHCDVCGKQKQEVNHWWMGNPGAISCGWVIHEWSQELVAERKHYCGQECAVTALSKWMQER